jgi:hypothetical protein
VKKPLNSNVIGHLKSGLSPMTNSHHLLRHITSTQIPQKIFSLFFLMFIHGCASNPIDNAKELQDFASETKIQATSAYRCVYVVAEKGHDSGDVAHGILFITENSAYVRDQASADDKSQSIRKLFEIEKSKVSGIAIDSGGFSETSLQIDFGNEVYAFFITKDSGRGLLPEKVKEVYSSLLARGYPEGTSTHHIYLSPPPIVFTPVVK